MHMATSRKPNTESSTDGIVSAEEVEAHIAGKDIVQQNTFDHDQLAGIESFSDAMALAAAQFDGVVQAHDDPNLGTGFRLTSDDDKFRLCGVPLLLLDWRFNPGDYGDDYVSIHAIQQDENGKAIKLVINDGGTGICRDLRDYTTKTARMGGVFVRRGLRVSEYDTDAETGLPIGKMMVAQYHKEGRKIGKGKTFYLDFSA